MKRREDAILAGVAGGVYAANHQPVAGEKLVGGARLGTVMVGPIDEWRYSAVIGFSNPDCVNEITITQVFLTARGIGYRFAD